MISKYREDKIRKEFFKLECDLKAQEDRVKVDKQKMKTRKEYLDLQRTKIQEF